MIFTKIVKMTRQRKAQTVKQFYHKETRRGNGQIEEANREETVEASVGNQNPEVLNHVDKSF